MKIIIAAILNLVFTDNAYAYIDPGTGSYVFQMAVATLLGASFALKTYWQKITIHIKKLFQKKLNPEEND